MERYEATFEIESKSDSYAARRILERVYDTIREESRTVRAGTADSSELLEQFEALREIVRTPAPGRLTVTYEIHDEGFES